MAKIIELKKEQTQEQIISTDAKYTMHAPNIAECEYKGLRIAMWETKNHYYAISLYSKDEGGALRTGANKEKTIALYLSLQEHILNADRNFTQLCYILNGASI